MLMLWYSVGRAPFRSLPDQSHDVRRGKSGLLQSGAAIVAVAAVTTGVDGGVRCVVQCRYVLQCRYMVQCRYIRMNKIK